MAESKPTKLQMAKEIQYLIAAAQDMSAVMDLDPPIKTDYLIDLKNKTVTATHLQNVVSNLQADIKKDASMIEPEDKFQPGTHAVLCNLNVKVPRPEETVDANEDEIESTSSPSPEIPDKEEVEEVVEKEKPIKKEKKVKKIKYTRFDASLDAMVELGINEKTDLLVKKAATLFISHGGPSNPKEEKIAVCRCKSIVNGAIARKMLG